MEINTLENAIFMSIKNGISFILDSRVHLYEHQSTYSPNLPLRSLFYVSDLYSQMTKDSNLYGTKVVYIPPPQIFVFYNEETEHTEREELRLSDMYMVQDGSPALELKVIVLNINPGYNKEIMENCKTLDDYSIFTARIRKYAKEYSLEEAVERAITECIEEVYWRNSSRNIDWMLRR